MNLGAWTLWTLCSFRLRRAVKLGAMGMTLAATLAAPQWVWRPDAPA